MKNTLIIIKWISKCVGLLLTQSVVLLYLKSHNPNLDIDSIDILSFILIYAYIISGAVLDLIESDDNKLNN